MKFAHCFGGGSGLVGKFKVGSTVVEGQPVIWLTTGAGTVQDPAAATDLTKAYGVTHNAATYSTTQADEEGVVTLDYDPLSIFNSRIVPSATAGTAYADGDGYFLTNETASAGGTTVTDSAAGGSTNDMIDGMLFCLSGANVGASRVITAHTASTSVVVTVPFDNAIAVGDTFVCSQYAPGVRAVQMTTDFTQSDGTIAGATGGEAITVDVWVDDRHQGTKTAPQLWHSIILYDHIFNAVA